MKSWKKNIILKKIRTKEVTYELKRKEYNFPME